MLTISAATWNDIWFTIQTQFIHNNYNYFLPSFSKRYLIRLFNQLLETSKVNDFNPEKWMRKQGYPETDIRIFKNLTSHLTLKKQVTKSSNSQEEKLYNVLISWSIFYLFAQIDKYLKSSKIIYPYIDPWLIREVINSDQIERNIFEQNSINLDIKYDFSRKEENPVLINRDIFLGVIAGLNSYQNLFQLQLVIENVEIDPSIVVEESRINELEDEYLIVIRQDITSTYYFNDDNFISGVASVIIWTCDQDYRKRIDILNLKSKKKYAIAWKDANPFTSCLI